LSNTTRCDSRYGNIGSHDSIKSASTHPILRRRYAEWRI